MPIAAALTGADYRPVTDIERRAPMTVLRVLSGMAVPSADVLVALCHASASGFTGPTARFGGTVDLACTPGGGGPLNVR
jgi:hypothetical protein